MSLWLAIFTVAVFVLLAFIVDGGQYMNARERAADIAEQAARAGADQVSVADLRTAQPGVPLTIPHDAACQAAGNLVDSYKNGALAANEASATQMTDCETPPDTPAETVTVRVSVTVNPVIPLLFGSFTTGAVGSATLQCGNAVAVTGAC